ncbi:NTE family protein [Ekhidna lutea]|uniref:NTE family protein n=1 Tax=Ekhidna lutea TaxID=447679 RepID=A0A239LCN4_EKHLU|nr:patatin-like phospholipase family protein [Ekhidna lutea]SNT28406.1 NTE family protein [Ekhidna lutea]
MSKENKKYDLGIALGGGGARGFAHLGILKALEEKGIKPDVISGVSAGAIAGAFIASGHSPKEAFDIIKQYKFTGISEFNIPKTGLLSSAKMKSRLLKKISKERLEDLEIPLIICVTNMLDGKAEYLDEGPLADIIQASASIPVLFSPVEMNGKLYSDGGIFDNVPVRPLKKICKKVIGASISPIQQINELTSLIQVTTRMFQLAVNPSNGELEKQCDLFIEPVELCNYDIMDTKHAQEIFDIGYEYTKQMDIKL